MKREERALRRLSDGEITLSKAAEIAETSVWDLAASVNHEHVAWVSDEHLDSDLEDL